MKFVEQTYEKYEQIKNQGIILQENSDMINKLKGLCEKFEKKVRIAINNFPEILPDTSGVEQTFSFSSHTELSDSEIEGDEIEGENDKSKVSKVYNNIYQKAIEKKQQIINILTNIIKINAKIEKINLYQETQEKQKIEATKRIIEKEIIEICVDDKILFDINEEIKKKIISPIQDNISNIQKDISTLINIINPPKKKRGKKTNQNTAKTQNTKKEKKQSINYNIVGIQGIIKKIKKKNAYEEGIIKCNLDIAKQTIKNTFEEEISDDILAEILQNTEKSLQAKKNEAITLIEKKIKMTCKPFTKESKITDNIDDLDSLRENLSVMEEIKKILTKLPTLTECLREKNEQKKVLATQQSENLEEEKKELEEEKKEEEN